MQPQGCAGPLPSQVEFLQSATRTQARKHRDHVFCELEADQAWKILSPLAEVPHIVPLEVQDFTTRSNSIQFLKVISLQVEDSKLWAKIEGWSQGGEAFLCQVKMCKLRKEKFL